MTCTQHGCGRRAVFRVFWPGKNPAPVYCVEHTVKARAILDTLGCPAVVEPVPAEGIVPDSQEAR